MHTRPTILYQLAFQDLRIGCAGNLSVRTYHGGDQGSMAIDDVISRVKAAVTAKSSFS